jgi:Holliday junction resolvase RusA-like endonuclease
MDDFRHLAKPAHIPARQLVEESQRALAEGRVLDASTLTPEAASLVLPYPPSVNAMQRIFTPPKKVCCPKCEHEFTLMPKDLGGAGNVTTHDARNYKQKLKLLFRSSPLAGPVELFLRVYRPRRSGDLDGRLKVMLDALQGIVYENDSQVEHIDAWRFDDKGNPRVEAEVRPLLDGVP